MSKFISGLKSFTKTYYLFNLLNIIERSAWFILIIQFPVYIAQKGEGGLEVTQEMKGLVYLYWVVLQNSVPIFAGNLADRIRNRRLAFFISFILLLIAYYSIAFIDTLFGALIGITLVSIGVGFYKPYMQGVISSQLNRQNSSLGWGMFFWLYNLGVFVFAVPYSKFLREISWEMVFFGAGSLFILNAAISLFIKNVEPSDKSKRISAKNIIKDSVKGLKVNGNWLFLLSMSGFAAIYMQFYETLPNFIYDWINTSYIVSNYNLSENFTMNTWAGQGISFEWLYNINTGLTLLLLIPVSIYLSNKSTVRSVIAGVSLVVSGFLLAIVFQNGIFLISGFVIYTVGELITNPKYTEHFSIISPKEKKSTYMGYLFLANLIGYSFGAIMGGLLYGKLGEKAALAKRYLEGKFGSEVKLNTAFTELQETLNLNPVETTNLLWDHYDPYLSLLPFVVVGVFSVIGLIIYLRKYVSR